YVDFLCGCERVDLASVVSAGGIAAVGRRTSEGAGPAGAVLVADLGLDVVPAALEVPQLALQVRLEPGPVLALEVLELLDVLLQGAALRLQAPHRLLVALPGVPLQRLGLRPRVPHELL